jgi:hypothetical protein
MTSKGWIVAGAVALGGVVFIRGGCLNQTTKAPDERLASRITDLCQIARGNVETPVRGVQQLGGYMAKHTGDLLGDFGATIATIERIPDDAKHDARARVARDRIRRPALACQADWIRFGNAVENNPEASALMQRFSVRLNRTIEIIFSGMRANDLLGLDLELPARGLGAEPGATAGAGVSKP